MGLWGGPPGPQPAPWPATEVEKNLDSWLVFQDHGNGVPTGEASHRGTRSANRSSSRGGSAEAIHASLPPQPLLSYTLFEWGWPRRRRSIRGRVLRGREPARGPAAAQGGRPPCVSRTVQVPKCRNSRRRLPMA